MKKENKKKIKKQSETNSNEDKPKKRVSLFSVIILCVLSAIIIRGAIEIAIHMQGGIDGKNFKNYTKVSYTGYNEELDYSTNSIIINNFEDYKRIMTGIKSEKITNNVLKYNKLFFTCNSLVLVKCGDVGAATLDSAIVNYDKYFKNVSIVMYENSEGFVSTSREDLYFIPVPKYIDKTNIRLRYTSNPDANYENENEIVKNDKFNETCVDKPIIYLYPEKEENVSVKLGLPENITCSYPKYKSIWNVKANTNGDLIDLDTNKKLYALYYESKNKINYKIEKDGFVIKGEDSAKFLEEKLAKLGLTERESEEFIVYWLPKLEVNKYNYIRFATEEEINKNMPLDIKPIPDTLIRVIMTYKGLENKIQVSEQKLLTKERKGFVAVEWGGSEIK